MAQQRVDGRWTSGTIARPPIEDGDIFRTALAIRALQLYAPPALGAHIRGRIARARTPARAPGQSLYALTEAGEMKPGHAAFKKGMAYLLATQRADGSWYVSSRSPKFQPFFAGGFPYGHDQWISSMATGWAAAALATALPGN